MERKYRTVTRPNEKNWSKNFLKWDRGWWNKHTKHASLRPPISIVIENSGEARGARIAGVATGLLKKARSLKSRQKLKKQAKMTQH